MERFTIFMLLFLPMLSCSSEQQKLSNEMERLEAAIEQNNSPEIANQLQAVYNEYLDKFPDDEALNARLLYRLGGLNYRMNKFEQAEKHLRQALKQYPDSDNSYNTALLLGSIYDENYQNTNLSNLIYQNIAETFSEQDLSQVSNKITPNAPTPDQLLQSLQQQIFDDSTGIIDYQAANDFINGSELYALLNPNKNGIPEMLFKAAETARTIRAHEKALSIYEWISDQYSQHPKAPQALFLRAFTLDNELQQKDRAKSLYEKFIAEYPNDEFADDAAFLLENLGKSNEEIIQSFEQQNQQVNQE